MAACGRCEKDLAMVAAQLISFVDKYAAVRPSTSNEKHRLEGYRRFGDGDVDTMDGNYWGKPHSSVFVDNATEGSLLQVPSPDKSYNWHLLNRLTLRF